MRSFLVRCGVTLLGIFVLPGVIALVALGIDQFSTLVRSRIGKAAASAFAALVISGYAAWSAPQLALRASRSIKKRGSICGNLYRRGRSDAGLTID